MPTLTEHPTIILAMQRLTALGWSVGGPLPDYAFEKVIARFQASTDTLNIDGDYGPKTAPVLFSNTAPRNIPGQLFPDFGRWLTYQESVKSATALRHGIANVPTPQQYRNMRKAYRDFYVPICNRFGKLPVGSFFRSKKLNKAVKGSATSSHMDGLAIDIDCDGLPWPTNKELYDWCRANLKFDTIIEEFADKAGNPAWIHISWRAIGYQRQQAMRAELKGNDVVYVYE